ncbi:MAG: carboxypeptidase regulatory-like domain-containing protein [Candidatus Polarisedimenticolia bacterium]
MSTHRSQLVLSYACAAAMMLAGCGGAADAPPAVPANAIPAGVAVGTSVIEGRVLFTGTAPPREEIRTGSDAACRHKQESPPRREDLVTGPEGGLQYAFVHAASGLGERVFAPPTEPVTLDQKGCVYQPHVVGVQVGQPLRVVNSDPTLHNVHTMSKENRPFNFGMPVEGQQVTKHFTKPEVMVKAKCDVHPWMGAWIGVSPHPFFQVTGADGAFALRGLPAGTYEIEVWHESLGTRRETVTLQDGETRTLTFTYPG